MGKQGSPAHVIIIDNELIGFGVGDCKTGIHKSVYRKRTPFLISFTITGVDRSEFVLVLCELS